MTEEDYIAGYRESLFKKMSLAPKVHSPYEEIMRKFSRDHEVKCRTVKLDVPTETRSEKQFITGSKYEGGWDALGMAGPNAVYTFPHGVIYEGSFKDGCRNGDGEMRYPTGEIMKGRFREGQMVERHLTFADGLEYSDIDWMYCQMPDRRFTVEYDTNVMPAGNSYMTAEQPTREIPPGYFDTGDGFYDPKTTMIYRADDVAAILRAPTSPEQKWIELNCRYSPDVELGPRSDLYEEWLEPEPYLPLPLRPSSISRATAWMFESSRSMIACDPEESMTYVRDFNEQFRPSTQSSTNITTHKDLQIEQPNVGKCETKYYLKSRSVVENSTFEI